MKRLWWTLAISGLLTLTYSQTIYQEQGDAGDLPETAQATGTDTTTPLECHSGRIGSRRR
ncbi:MAG: hypothetical protein KatS3mg017_0855 [Fimbriimonadales bacterium]|nr:MAG: hypothetical protein KatS3mg017_0855 [Fimbriimonadales bacterium]